MKAVVFHGIGDIRVDDVPEPTIQDPTDAIVRLTSSAICGTDLHFVRGTMSGFRPGTILGHEGVGVIEQLGDDVRNLEVGDRVVIASTIACGSCSYCRAGYYAQCDTANPNGPQAGTAFFGGPEETGPFDGLQAEKARVPFANVGLVKLPGEITDDQAIMLSDIFPTGWFGAEMAEIEPGDVVGVFGCGPVGQFAIASAKLHGADRVIDAVGVDAERPKQGPAAQRDGADFDQELAQVAPETHPDGESWVPGDAPSQALRWEVQAVDKAGTISIIGVYPPTMDRFPIGEAMNRNLTMNMGNCHHRRYIPHLIDLVRGGVVDPAMVLTQHEPVADAIEAYRAFDERQPGWLKVELLP